jgi:cellulose synthase/poly-beta-1,6-N-acetylglucosamine synthase-like glycosyltransferase
MTTAFWILLFIIFYTYLGYGVLLYALVKMRGEKVHTAIYQENTLPAATHIIAAYNEEDYIENKIQNALDVEYPSDKYQVWVVTDGSTDQTVEIVKRFPQVKLFHQDSRQGKIHAVNRIMPEVKDPIVVFSDANTEINKLAIKNLTRHYVDPSIGCVSGEKRIEQEIADEASSAGEGIYWRYESFLKKYDYKLYSVVGAAGELFSVRTSLYEEIDRNTIIEDFFLTLKIASKGYRIAYEPEAFAVEKSSESVAEESKRKIRIAAGGLQAVWRLRMLFNIFKYKWLSFQFISHRVLRWTITPLALPIAFGINLLLINNGSIYSILFFLQSLFYFLAIVGFLLQKRKMKIKIFFIPFYFTFMNVAVYLGLIRFLKGQQSVIWEKAARKK